MKNKTKQNKTGQSLSPDLKLANTLAEQRCRLWCFFFFYPFRTLYTEYNRYLFN